MLFIIFLALTLLVGTIGCIYGCRNTGSDQQKKQEIVDAIAELQMKSELCKQFDLDSTAIYTDDITKTQIIMHPGKLTFWYIYDYNLWVQRKISEAQENPQNQSLQETAIQIKSVGQEGLITMEDLYKRPEKIAAMWGKGPMGYNDLISPGGLRYHDLEGLKPENWYGFSGALLKEHLNRYSQKGIEKQGTAIEVILAKFKKLDTITPGAGTPALYESCRAGKWKEILNKPVDQINEDESLMLALVYIEILDQEANREIFLNHLVDKAKSDQSLIRWEINQEKIAKIQKALDLYVFLLYEEYETLAAMKHEDLGKLYGDVPDYELTSMRQDHLDQLKYNGLRDIGQKQALLIAINDLERYKDNREDPWLGLVSQDENTPPIRVGTSEGFRQGGKSITLTYCDHIDKAGQANLDKTLTIDITISSIDALEQVQQLIAPYLE